MQSSFHAQIHVTKNITTKGLNCQHIQAQGGWWMSYLNSGFSCKSVLFTRKVRAGSHDDIWFDEVTGWKHPGTIPHFHLPAKLLDSRCMHSHKPQKHFKTQYTCSVLQNTSSNSLWFGKGNASEGRWQEGQDLYYIKIVQLFTQCYFLDSTTILKWCLDKTKSW